VSEQAEFHSTHFTDESFQAINCTGTDKLKTNERKCTKKLTLELQTGPS